MNTVFSPNQTVLYDIYALWNSTVQSLIEVAGIQYFIIFQRIPEILPGNSLGLNPSEAPLVLCLLSITWNLPQDDQLINNVAKGLLLKIEQVTKSLGLFRKYKYLNYAANFQNPIASYGSQSVANLRQVSKKYDPTGLFQTSVPGGFKLFNFPAVGGV